MGPRKDLTGKQFGKLTVIQVSKERKNNQLTWECKCSCGNPNIIYVTTSNLNNGRTRSCGCLRKETIRKMAQKQLIDITGNTYGELTVLERAYDKEQEFLIKGTKKVHPIWKCRCSCGNITYVQGTALKTGGTKSCGHVFSYGNQKLQHILQENNILFKKEYSINYNNKNYRFDFALMDNSNQLICLIEYDGEQHFKPGRGWNTPENFEKQQETDQIKNEYAQLINVPLLRIPYWDFNRMDINYLNELFYKNNIKVCLIN